MQRDALIAAGHRLHSHLKNVRKMKKRLGRLCPVGDVKVPGLHYLGAGAYGVAFACGEEYVVKYSSPGVTRNAYGAYRGAPHLDAWQIYAEYCVDRRAPNLPHIIHFERVSEYTAWAIMPRYEPLLNAEVGVAVEFDDGMRSALLAGSTPPGLEWMAPLAKLAAKQDLYVDIHKGNVMRNTRDGSYVLTDPFM